MRHSRKAILAASALAALGLLYASMVVALTALSTWAEKEVGAFPYKDEDWLRYLLPAKFGPDDRPRFMIAGPSTARENLRHERFAQQIPAFGIHQGGISLGTIDDTLAALEYVERVYGASALPRFMVLGVSPRFVANIPADRPFRQGLDRYSPHFSTHEDATGIVLVPKGLLEGFAAKARFIASKGPERFRTALLAFTLDRLDPDAGYRKAAAIAIDAPAPATRVDQLMRIPIVDKAIRRVGMTKILSFPSLEILAWAVSPYKYSLNPPLQYTPGAHLREGWWKTTYEWDPTEYEAEVRGRLRRLVDLAQACNIDVWVVNLPERDVSSAQFDETKYRAYLDIVRSEIPEARFLELRDFLRPNEFYDREHSTPAGSARLTDAIIAHMKATMPAADVGQVSRPDACIYGG